MKSALIALRDGTVYYGKAFGAETTAVGELVFCTSMTGYQEALTDPSYAGQVLLFTYPLQGNYGTNKNDFESRRVWARAFIVREACTTPIHRQSLRTLHEYLSEAGVPGVSEVDTRAIVRRVREEGVMSCAVSTEIDDVRELIERARAFDYEAERFIDQVSDQETFYGVKGTKKVVLIDGGVKLSIIRQLNIRGVDVVSVKYNTPVREIERHNPDGIVVSNGPGNPALLHEMVSSVRRLYESYPLFGICLGHQILAHAIGGKCYKLKFGHRSANQPVLDVTRGRVIITTQNHGYAVDETSLPKPWYVSQRNANDNSVEAIAHDDLPIVSVQYHPEANPGPYDARFLFDTFVSYLHS